MLNLFRNLLLNISAADQTGSTVAEIIPTSYFPLTYPAAMESVRVALVGTGSVDLRAFRTQMALRLADSTELSTYLLDQDNIYTFDPKNIKHFSKEFVFDLVAIDRRIRELTNLSDFYREARKRLPEEIFNGLQYISKYHDNPVWRLAAFIVMFLLAANTLL